MVNYTTHPIPSMMDRSLQGLLYANWRDEMEAIQLYTQMAGQESGPRRRIYERLAEVERKHARFWESQVRKRGGVPRFVPGWKTIVLSMLGKALGHHHMVEFMSRMERDSLRAYAQQVSKFEDAEVIKGLREILPEEGSHERVLQALGKRTLPSGREHPGKNRNSIKDAIFGVDDGLLSTFSLITGVAGGVSDNMFILLAGLAGALAGAISIGAGSYVSTQSEKEVIERESYMERTELRVGRKDEVKELALMYELNGASPTRAWRMARRMLSSKTLAIDALVREEFGARPTDTGDPLKEALVSSVAFSVGASIPVLPWALLQGSLAFYTSVGLSLIGFFLIGFGRTLVTGKDPMKSGIETFLIGLLAAGVTYAIGRMMGIVV